MTKRALTSVVLALWLILPLHAAEFIVVVNHSNTHSSFSKTELKRMFTGKQTSLGAVRIVPINLPLDSDIARAFLEQIVGMTPEEYKKYWLEQQVRGQATAPQIQRSGENVVAIVSELPGGIGYIAPGSDTSTVKTVKITD